MYVWGRVDSRFCLGDRGHTLPLQEPQLTPQLAELCARVACQPHGLACQWALPANKSTVRPSLRKHCLPASQDYKSTLKKA